MKKLINIFLIFIMCFVIIGCKEKELEKNKIEVSEIKEETTKDYKMSVITFGDALIHPAVFNDAIRGSSTYNFKKMFTEFI